MVTAVDYALLALRASSCALALLVLSACGQTGEWTEEVRLSNGEILKVHRTLQWKKTHPLGEAVSYISGKGSMTLFEKSGAALGVWEGDAERLMVLDFDNQSEEYFLITSPSQCSRYAQLGAPIPPYAQYRLRRNKWIRILDSNVAIGRSPNMLVRPSHTEKELVTWEEVSKRNLSEDRPYKEIVASGGLPGCSLAKDYMK